MSYPKYSVDLLVVRHNPSNKCKGAQTRPKVVREPENDKSDDREVNEEAISGHGPTVCKSTFLWLMQSTEKDC